MTTMENQSFFDDLISQYESELEEFLLVHCGNFTTDGDRVAPDIAELDEDEQSLLLVRVLVELQMDNFESLGRWQFQETDVIDEVLDDVAMSINRLNDANVSLGIAEPILNNEMCHPLKVRYLTLLKLLGNTIATPSRADVLSSQLHDTFSKHYDSWPAPSNRVQSEVLVYTGGVLSAPPPPVPESGTASFV